MKLLGIFLLFISFTLSAQKPGGITIEETIGFINAKLKGDVKVEVKRTKLTLDFFKGDKLYRKDEVYCGEIDTVKVFYSAEEKSFILGCNSENAECVHRDIYDKEISRYYNRVTIDVTELDEASIKSLRKAFIHLIRLMTNVKYSSTEPF